LTTLTLSLQSLQKSKTMVYFELVNLCSGNRIGEFDTEDEALRDVLAVKRRRGAEALAAIALAREDEQGNITTIAEGDELASRSERVSAVAL
jgi:hypothetical protein